MLPISLVGAQRDVKSTSFLSLRLLLLGGGDNDTTHISFNNKKKYITAVKHENTAADLAVIIVHDVAKSQFYFMGLPYDQNFGFNKFQFIVTILNMLSKDFEKGGQIDVIFTNFAKAFNKVPHSELNGKV
jgi:hypothetical protein